MSGKRRPPKRERQAAQRHIRDHRREQQERTERYESRSDVPQREDIERYMP